MMESSDKFFWSSILKGNPGTFNTLKEVCIKRTLPFRGFNCVARKNPESKKQIAKGLIFAPRKAEQRKRLQKVKRQSFKIKIKCTVFDCLASTGLEDGRIKIVLRAAVKK